MDWIAPAAFIAALLSATTVAGVLWRRRQGAVSTPGRGSAGSPDAAPLEPDVFAPGSGLRAAPFGRRATLVQFSTEYCTSCPSTRRVLSGISERTSDVAYIDVDVTERADLVKRFRILQTPTVLVLDGAGTVRNRIGGAVRPRLVEEALEGIR